MTFTRIVEVDFGSDGSWTDITSYTLDVNVVLGSSDPDRHVADIGNATITLMNTDRRFSPDYSGGPYYGEIIPGLPIRISCSDGVNTWRTFTGWVIDWVVTAGQYGSQRVTITAQDILGRLQDTTISLPLQEGQTADYVARLVTSTVFKSGLASGDADIWYPLDGNEATIGDKTYTWKSSLTPLEGELAMNSHNYAAYLTDYGVSLAEAVNGASGAGTYYAGTTTKHPDVAAVGYAGLTVFETATGTINLNDASGNSKIGAAFKFGPNVDGDEPREIYIRNIWIFVLQVGSPTGTLTMRLEHGDSSDKPSGTLVHVSATATADESAASGWVNFDFGDGFTIPYDGNGTSDWYWLVLSTDRSPSASNYTAWYYASTVSSSRLAYATYSGSWSAVTTGLTPLLMLPSTVFLEANVHGAWGNDIALSGTAGRFRTSGATFTGGADGPSGLDFDTCIMTLETSGDIWSPATTNALTAIEDLMASEYGYFWAARDATLTLANQQYVFLAANDTAALTSTNDHTDQVVRVSRDDIRNHIVISYRPRACGSLQVVARSTGTITIPPNGRSGVVVNWNPANILPDDGTLTITLPFVNLESGKVTGARDLIPLVPGTDYKIYDTPDDSGYEYTYLPYLKISLAITAAGLTVTLDNSAIGPLYLQGLQIRGYPILSYDVIQMQADDTDSQSDYGTREWSFELPFAADTAEIMAKALSQYVLSRNKSPYTKTEMIAFDCETEVGGVPVMSIEIGDKITITETQTAIAGQSFMVIGVEYMMPETGLGQATFHVRRLDDTTYWLLEETNFSELDETTILGL